MADIVRTDGILGGEPRIDGSRVGVFDVYELVVEGGHSPADIADQLDLTVGGSTLHSRTITSTPRRCAM